MKKQVMYCKQPDRDVPKIVCGFPLPCPYHTVVIDASNKPTVTIPAGRAMTTKTLRRIADIADMLKGKE